MLTPTSLTKGLHLHGTSTVTYQSKVFAYTRTVTKSKGKVYKRTRPVSCE